MIYRKTTSRAWRAGERPLAPWSVSRFSGSVAWSPVALAVTAAAVALVVVTIVLS
ncbi:hypothetical protein ACQP1K_05320 [Sphaerimonospora sp. CA-214678]|uniref:hypothetical protein n=1 Tax=Sphaerimonospora sp. CA-214678 TaxID=3240029 RepID=UPI003D9487C7